MTSRGPVRRSGGPGSKYRTLGQAWPWPRCPHEGLLDLLLLQVVWPGAEEGVLLSTSWAMGTTEQEVLAVQVNTTSGTLSAANLQVSCCQPGVQIRQWDLAGRSSLYSVGEVPTMGAACNVPPPAPSTSPQARQQAWVCLS